MINKKDIVKTIANKHDDFTQKEIVEILDDFFDIIKQTVAKGEKVSIIKFGTFESRVRAARTAKNPQTGELMKIQECTVPKFKPASSFKDIVKEASYYEKGRF